MIMQTFTNIKLWSVLYVTLLCFRWTVGFAVVPGSCQSSNYHCQSTSRVVETRLGIFSNWVSAMQQVQGVQSDDNVETVNSDNFKEILADFMIISHEAKLKAVQDATREAEITILRLQEENEMLKDQLNSETENSKSLGNSFEMPVSNKELTEKYQLLKEFVSKYIVNSSLEKKKAVDSAKAQIIARYEKLS